MKRTRRFPSVSALALAFSLALASGTPSACADAGDIAVSRAWSRATVGKGAPGVAYFTIENRSAESDRILSVSSPVAARASVHRTVREGGMMQMRPAANLLIAPASRVAFEPGGLHVMLMGLREALVSGRRFSLTIRFEKAGELEVDVAVAGVGAVGPPDPPPTP